MIRISLLLLLVAFLSAYAWRNWFVSVCGAVLLLGVVQHPDFPNSIGGIQGANPWNFLILNVVLAWANSKRAEGRVWDMPKAANWWLLMYLLVIIVGVVRLIPHDLPDYPVSTILSEDLINCVKWVIPGLLLFDGCRTRKRVIAALFVVLALYLVLAIQVIRWMPLSYAISGGDLSYRASKITQNEIGYNRVTLSMMLAGASWAVLAAVVLARTRMQRFLFLGSAGIIALGQALTGGRTGYGTWILIGLILSSMRWRKLLLVIPVVVIGVGIALPGVRERMLQGFGEKKNGIVELDEYEMTSGRNIAWPRVIEEIKKAPLIGYGREGMVTTGVRDELWNEYYESFPHPHQAYLELILDNGIIGLLMIVPFYLFALRRSVRLLLDRSDPLLTAVGCVAFALISALLIGSFGGQTFYPREGAVGMWAAIGIMLRVSVERERYRKTRAPVSPRRVQASPAPQPVSA